MTACLVALAAAGCSSPSGERPGIMQSLQQGLGAAAMAVGTATGNKDMANKGAEMFDRGRSVSSGTTPGSTEPGGGGGADCLQYLNKQRDTMAQNARQCQVNEDLMRSANAPGGSPPSLNCGGSVGQIDQRMAQQACGRVYLCATAAYTVAISEAQRGAQCKTAMDTGLARYPIPK